MGHTTEALERGCCYLLNNNMNLFLSTVHGVIVKPMTGVIVAISEWLLLAHKSSTDRSGRLLARHVICFYSCHGRNNVIMWSFLQL